VLKGYFIALKGSMISFSPNAPKNHTRKNYGLFHFSAKEALLSEKMVQNEIEVTQENAQATKSKSPKCPSKLTIDQQVIHRF